MKFVKGAAIAVVAVLVIAFVALATWEPFFADRGEAPEYREYTAEIVRDTRTLCFLRGQVTSDGATLLNASCIYKIWRDR